MLSTLLAEIYGPDAANRRAIAAKRAAGVRGGRLCRRRRRQFWRAARTGCASPSIRRRSNIHGVEEQAVYDTIGALIGGTEVGYSQRGGGLKPIAINVALPRSDLTLDERLLSTRLPAGGTPRQGANVELGDVVTFKRETTSYPIFRHNGRFAEMVSAELAGRYRGADLRHACGRR